VTAETRGYPPGSRHGCRRADRHERETYATALLGRQSTAEHERKPGGEHGSGSDDETELRQRQSDCAHVFKDLQSACSQQFCVSFTSLRGRPTVHIKRHFDLVTTEVASARPMLAGDSQAVAIAPGRVVEIAIPGVAGETIAIATSSHDYFDTVAVLLAPDGTAVTGGDDDKGYFAAFEWAAIQTATYRLRVTFFEALNSGLLLVSRK
jgi:hypothetical protein